MVDNTKLMARIPIIPEDFANKEQHKLNELVMDYDTNDLYAKTEDGYVNITGNIKEEIKNIQDGSMVVHLVTEDSLPPSKERPSNHWYFVITNAVTSSGATVNDSTYIYYGLINSYSKNKNYILVAQNMIDGADTVKVVVEENYNPVFYVPITIGVEFMNADTNEAMTYSVQDRIYALNSKGGTFIAYDVYTIDVAGPGTYNIAVSTTGNDYFTITFESNISITGFVAPKEIHIHDGDTVGDLLPIEPDKDDARYIFKGWSTDKKSAVIIDKTYKPESTMVLYAWYEYNDDPTMLTYYSTYVSSGKGVV